MRRIFAAAIFACTAPVAALAHAVLIDSTPAPQGHVRAGRVAVSLRYNSRLDAARSKLVLKHGATAKRLAFGPGAGANTLAATVDLAPGDYVLQWQVLSVDGHLTRGNIPFTVDPK